MRMFSGDWLRRLQYLIHRRRREEELQREMQIHREMMGEPRRFGNTLRLREESRDVWGWTWIDNLCKDLRYAARQLYKVPGFTLLAVIALGIGIGSVTTFSGLMKAVLFAELPVRDPASLRQLGWTARTAGSGRLDSSFSYATYRDLQTRSTSFSDLICWSNPTFVNLRTADDLVRASAQFVSGNFFQAIGAATVIGRPVSLDDESAGAAHVAVLSYGTWQRLFGGDAAALGKPVNVDGVVFAVIGVLQSEDFQNTPTERWTADITIPIARHGSAKEPSCRIVGRLRPGVSEEPARQESEQLVRQAFSVNPPQLGQDGHLDDSRSIHVGLRGLRTVDQLNFTDLTSIFAFVMLIGSLLAIICSNIAGMMFARGAARSGEVATRLALGASRRRVVGQLFMESLLLAGIAGSLAAVLCYTAGKFIPWPFALDLPVLAVAAGSSFVTALLFGLAPALNTTRLGLASVMKRSTPGSLGGTFRCGNILIGVQVTLSFLLLVATGLQVRALIRTLAPSVFEPERVLTVTAHGRPANYIPERSNAYFEQAVRRLETLPGVESATLSSGDGIFAGANRGMRVIGDYIGPRFFATMRIPLVSGRDLAWADTKGAPLVAVVNQMYARTMHPGINSLGQTVRTRAGQAEIVGVVADSNSTVGDALGMGQSAHPTIYYPFQQQARGVSDSMILSVRVTGDPSALAASVRRTVMDVDPNVVVDPVETQASQMNFGFRERRLVAALLAVAGIVALVEVAFGIYGILSFFVGARTAEIGLRVALGAQRFDVIQLVLRQSMLPVAFGTIAGLIGAPVLTRVLDSGGFLVGALQVRDEVAIIAIALLVLGIALAAAFVPARRACRIAPTQALRHE